MTATTAVNYCIPEVVRIALRQYPCLLFPWPGHLCRDKLLIASVFFQPKSLAVDEHM